MRSSLGARACVIAVVFTVGCTTPATSLRKPVASVGEQSPTKDDAKPAQPPVASSAADIAKADSPFKPSREKSAPSASSKTDAVATADKKAVEESVTKSSDATVAKATPHFTRQTLQLIDSELRDATPAERAQWFEELKQVDAELIPEILRARRLSLQLAEKNPLPQPVPTAAPRDELLPLETLVSAPRFSPAEAPSQPGPQVVDLTPRPAKAPPVIEHTGVQQTGFAAENAPRTASTADYQVAEGTSQAVTQAVYKFDPQRPQQPIVLQNMEYQPAPTTAQTYSAPPSNPVPQLDPRLLPQSSVAAPAAVPWPTPKSAPVTTAAPSASSVPFGAGFVQNVVGLMPNRGGATNVPVAPAVSASPVVPPANAGWTQDLDRTTAYLEQEVATLKPGTTPEVQAAYIRKHVALRMLYLMGQHQERALTAIPGLPPAEQEFWQQLFWGLSNALDADHIPNPKDRAAQTITQLNSALRRLQEQADLQIRNVAFCRQIQYFGNYERFPRDEFRPGQEVLLYAEIDNFKSEPTADGQYRTLLRSTLELLSPSGELRKIIDFPATEDLCRNYRRDYFHNYQFVIPERLPLGPHTLKLTVFDELSGKMSSYSVNFVVK